jgi:hypothetical protein
METLIAVLIVMLAAGGLSLGLLLTGKPPETSCDGLACIKSVRCAMCPKRLRAEGGSANG